MNHAVVASDLFVSDLFASDLFVTDLIVTDSHSFLIRLDRLGASVRTLVRILAAMVRWLPRKRNVAHKSNKCVHDETHGMQLHVVPTTLRLLVAVV